MQRNLEVVIDSASWAPKPAPAELVKRAGLSKADVLGALLYTAYVTRPPTVHGFHLSDYWAWLRYLPAIAASSDLRLCADWDNVDSHQKAVLSDELGVGFATQFVTNVFDCLEFTDTLYVVNVLSPTRFSLKGGAKRGPRKSPDYIARDRKSNYIVLECKGTQTSRSSLEDAIARGRKQKGNIRAKKPARIKHSLVAGLFIPQWGSSEAACIQVCDPPREGFEGLLSEEPTERIDDAITQIALAKQLALAGLAAVPTYLGSTQLSETRERPAALMTELHDRARRLSNEYEVMFDSAEIRARMPQAESPTRTRFSVRTPLSILEQLVGNTSFAEVISQLRGTSAESAFKIRSEDVVAELTTPLGFGFRLEVERAR
jgi:hypothetical protein